MKSILITIMVFYLSCNVYGQRILPKQKSIEINSSLFIKKDSESYFSLLYSLEYNKNLVSCLLE